MRKIFTAALAGALAFLLAAQSFAAGLGTVTYQSELTMGEGTTLYTVEAENGAGREQAYIFEYMPNGTVVPEVVYGNKLYGKSTILQTGSYAEKQGETLIGGINGDYFTLSNGLPNGLVVVDGRIASSDSWKPAIGFYADGTAIIGRPQMGITLTGAGQSINISCINKLRSTIGFYLYTEDYSAETRNTGAGTDVILRKNSAQPLTIGGSQVLTVESVTHGNQSVAIPAGCMILSLDDKTAATMPAYQPGDQLTLTTNCTDTRWNTVASAVGGMEILIENGAVQSGLSATREPRTACGIRADGSLVFITVDGRQPGYSVGISLADLAAELAARGCVSAINLDGGGSTATAVKYPGKSAFEVINQPSDGSPRPGANYILFLNKMPSTGLASRLYVYPYDTLALPGARVPLSVGAVDESYRTATSSLPAVTYSADGGSMEGNVFVAGSAGQATVYAEAAGVESGLARITVTDKVDVIKLFKDKKAVSSLSLEASQSAELDVAAYIGNRTVHCADTDFTFSVTNGIGTISPEGTFKATDVSGVSGVITVAYGATTASLNVTVGKLPVGLSEFETVSDMWSVTNGTMTLETNNAYARYGFSSGRLDYDLSADKGGAVVMSAPAAYAANGASYITLWVYGDNSGLTLSADFSSDAKTPKLSENQYVIDFTGWKGLSFALPAGGSRLYSLILTDTAGTGPKGRLWFDQLGTAHGAGVDVAPPVMNLAMGGETLPVISGTITDGAMVTKGNVSVRLDGASAAFAYAEGSGQFNFNALEGLSSGVHRVTITAKDIAGNLARKSFDFSIQGGDIQPFADMNGHWAVGFVGFLSAKGVLTGAQTKEGLMFNPEKNITRLEMAAMLARYLGYDPAKYADVELPYADLKQIDDWGLGYVKALYAEGIMRGRQDGSKVCFAPKSSITREEAVTTLGRTCAMGYPDNTAGFSDSSKISAYAKPYLDLFVMSGVLAGYTDGTIKPKNNIKRSEVASIMYKLY